MGSVTHYLKAIFILIVILFGIYSFWLSLSFGFLILVYTTVGSLIISIIVWTLVGRIATTNLFVGFLSAIRRVKPIEKDQIESVEKGYFVLESEKVEKRSGFLFHLSETLDKPLFPILFIVGIISAVTEFTGITDFYSLTNTLIVFFGSILLGLIVPIIWIVRDSDWMFFNYADREVKRASDWLESFFKGFASAGTILGFITLFIGLGVFNLAIFVMLFILGTAGFIIVITVFFYLFFHRKYVETVNSKLKEKGLLVAKLKIIPTVDVSD